VIAIVALSLFVAASLLTGGLYLAARIALTDWRTRD
jgi:hypothetical protein